MGGLPSLKLTWTLAKITMIFVDYCPLHLLGVLGNSGILYSLLRTNEALLTTVLLMLMMFEVSFGEVTGTLNLTHSSE